MSKTEGQESKNEDHGNPECATEHAETRDKSVTEHVKKPYSQGDIITIVKSKM